MKRSLLAAACGFMFANSGWSIPSLPYLQLDAANGTYDSATQTILATDNPFTLFALVDTSSSSYVAGGTYYLSAAITPKTLQNQTTSFGSFSINGVTYSLDSGMQWGTPPADALLNSQDLPSHGIYDTHYTTIGFTLDSSKTATAYNSQDDPGGFTVSPTGSLIYEDFLVDAAGLAAGYDVHFDLYTLINGETVAVAEFAPFGHDAQSGGTSQVPDGGTTVTMLGISLLGIHALRRKLMAC